MHTKKNIEERPDDDAGAYAHCGPWAEGLRLWRMVPADRFGPSERAAVTECMRRTSLHHRGLACGGRR